MDGNFHFKIFGLAILTVGCFAGCFRELPNQNHPERDLEQQSGKQAHQIKENWESVVLPLKTRTISTIIKFELESPLPWKDGNHLSFHFRKLKERDQTEEWAHWIVLNIHSENFFKITRQLGIKDIELQVFHEKLSPTVIDGPDGRRSALQDNGYAVVTDSRIPREWFLNEPKTSEIELNIWNAARTIFPDSFGMESKGD